jgi:hypothetical protein
MARIGDEEWLDSDLQDFAGVDEIFSTMAANFREGESNSSPYLSGGGAQSAGGRVSDERQYLQHPC